MYLTFISILLFTNSANATKSNLPKEKNISAKTEHIAFWYKFYDFDYIINKHLEHIINVDEFGVDLPISENTIIGGSLLKNRQIKDMYGGSLYVKSINKTFLSHIGSTLINYGDLSLYIVDANVDSNFYLISNFYACAKMHTNISTIVYSKDKKDYANLYRFTPKIGLGINFTLSDSFIITPEIVAGYSFSKFKYKKNETNTDHIMIGASLEAILGICVFSITCQTMKLQHYSSNPVFIMDAKLSFNL